MLDPSHVSVHFQRESGNVTNSIDIWNTCFEECIGLCETVKWLKDAKSERYGRRRRGAHEADRYLNSTFVFLDLSLE